MSKKLGDNEWAALDADLKGYEAPLAGVRLQQAILADFDQFGAKRRGKFFWREFFGQFLAPAGAFSALTLAGFVSGVVTVGGQSPTQEDEAFAYLSEAYETALLGAAADGEEVEIWQEF